MNFGIFIVVFVRDYCFFFENRIKEKVDTEQIMDFLTELSVPEWNHDDMSKFVDFVVKIAEERGIWRRVHHNWRIVMRVKGVEPLPPEPEDSNRKKINKAEEISKNGSILEVKQDIEMDLKKPEEIPQKGENFLTKNEEIYKQPENKTDEKESKQERDSTSSEEQDEDSSTSKESNVLEDEKKN